MSRRTYVGAFYAAFTLEMWKVMKYRSQFKHCIGDLYYYTSSQSPLCMRLSFHVE